MGHFCRICGRAHPNGKFSGRGHWNHVCKDCQRMPREKRDRIERLDELHRFLHQSNISAKNLARLQVLCGHADFRVATLAALIHDIVRAVPGKRKRWLKLVQRDRSLFHRAVRVLGVEFFEDLLAGNGDFESPLWDILEQCRNASPWTSRPCDCGSGRAFRDCCLEPQNALIDEDAAGSSDEGSQEELSPKYALDSTESRLGQL
jgi:hypothetical protein